MQSRIRKVAALARTGKKGRVLSSRPKCATSSSRWTELFKRSRAFIPADPEPPAPASSSNLQLYSCLKLLSMSQPHSEKCLDSVSQDLSACVLNTGMTLALWQENSDLFVQVIAHIAAAAVPSSVLQHLKAGQITAHGCWKHDNATLSFGPLDQTAHHPVFLHLRTVILPGHDSIMR